MPRHPLSSLGRLIREKRGDNKLRETAKAIGIGAATLMRVENGRIPDLETFGKLCIWLNVEPGNFLGFEKQESSEESHNPTLAESTFVSAHLKADQTPKPETVQALANMILHALQRQPKCEDTLSNGNP